MCRIDFNLNRQWPWLAVGGFVVAGLVARIIFYGFSLGGDELSTVWIVKDQSLGHVLSEVRSDSEITPPFYFVLAWLAMKLGSSPELVRLPALVAGTATIPVVFLLGRRLFGNTAGLVAAAVTAASPFMVYFSAYARGYALMLLMLFCSTLFLIWAVEKKGLRWWVLYAVATCLAMYSHYTALFVLLGQFLWVLWAHPDSRKPVLIATACAGAGFLPWIPGYLADSNSPTTPLLAALQKLQSGDGLHGRLVGLQNAVFWRVSPSDGTFMGRLDIVLTAAGSIGLLIAATWRSLRDRAQWAGSFAEVARKHRNLILVLILLFLTPIGQLLMTLVGTDVYGGRNLAGIWTGIPLAIGGLAAASGPVLGLVGAILAIAGLGIGTVNLLDSEKTEFDFRGAAQLIDSRATPKDSVVDAALLTPVPLTSFDVYLDKDLRQYRLGLSMTDPPFTPATVEIPDPQGEIDRAFATGDHVFLASLDSQQQILDSGTFNLNGATHKIPPGWVAVDQEVFPGMLPIVVTEFEKTPAGDAAKEDSGAG